MMGEAFKMLNNNDIKNHEFITGIFLKELKNRFLCTVKVDGVAEECYVPSSCHLRNFLHLKGKRVVLVPTQGENPRTRYALYAMPYKRNYIVLNTSMSNVAVENSIHSRHFSFLGKRTDILREHYIDDYKSDLYIPKSETIIEIKSILSSLDSACFPTVYSERTQKQLKNLQELLGKEFKVFFIIVSLNPYLKEIVINKDSEFYFELCKCIEMGMELRAFTSYLRNDGIFIKREIPVKGL